MSEAIVNSLGVQYSGEYIRLALRQLVTPHPEAAEQLKQKLADMFTGDVTLLSKGRDAIEYVVRALGVQPGEQVLCQALTCHAVVLGLQRAGAEVVFVDVAPESVNPSVATLAEALKRAPRARAVFVQHLLGVPAPITEIRAWCDKKNLLLIEDLAQAFGAQDETGELLGQTADGIVLSFGRDKILDGLSGGAAIIKTAHSTVIENVDAATMVPGRVVYADLFYPLLTAAIRATSAIGIGKLLFQLARRLGWINSPIQSVTSHMAVMPAAYAPLVLWQLEHLEEQLKHRRIIAHRYFELLQGRAGVRLHVTREQIERGANLRFPLSVTDVDSLIAFLKTQNMHLSDRWYRAPVDSGSLGYDHPYLDGTCPQAEARAREIMNLPTHRLITPAMAKNIVGVLNQWSTHHHTTG